MKNEQVAMNFWGRVEQMQSANGKTNLKQLCKSLEIPYQTVNNAKAKATLPNALYIAKIAKALNCSIEWLLFGTDVDISLNSANEIAQQILHDERKKALIDKITKLSEPELHAIEVLLKIR